MDLQFFLIAFTLVSGSYSLVKEWIDSVENSNCNLTVRNRNVTDVMAFGSPAIDCPPWYYTSEDGKYCLPGRVIKDTISINPTTKQISIQNFYCMTKTGNVTVLGGCLYSAVHALQYIPLPCNASELNDYMCAGLNREGKLCGRCVKGFTPSVYSYSMKCVPCSSYHSRNIFKYILIAFGPMSLFIFVVTLCHISPTSSYIHGFMLFSQIITLAPIMRIETLLVNYFNKKHFGASVVLCLFSVWNLDFFRLIYTPFCIHPDMTVVQSLALDYLIAFYPFLILLLVYSVVKLYTHSFKPVVYLWGFVRPTIMFFKTLFNIETSFVHSFATVFFLVAIKLQSVSLDLLHFTQLYHNRGPQPAKTFLYLAGDVEYFGLEHWPYGLFALCTLLLFLVFPALLMFFYPCACFQRLLNRLHYNSLALKTIMDAYQGIYKDGTNNTRDYRYFSGIFFISRAATIIILSSMYSYYFISLMGLLFIGLTLSVAIFQPQRGRFSYTMDCLFTSSLAIICLLVGTSPPHPDRHQLAYVIDIIAGVIGGLLPFLYIFGLITMWIFAKARLPQRFVRWAQRKKNNDCYMYAAI